MRHDKLKKVNVRFFLIPLLLLSVLSALLITNDIFQRIGNEYQRLENSTKLIADSYASRITKTQEAHQLIVDLLEQRILVASESILLLDLDRIDVDLQQIADRLHVDQINLYNEFGVVTHSSVDEYVGWVAYPGHPVFEFFQSDLKSFSEDIRRDTESGIYFKYGYVRSDTNQFVQIGVLADDVMLFLNRFNVQNLLDELVSSADIESIFLTDQHMNVIASSHDSMNEPHQLSDDWIEHISMQTGMIRFDSIDGQRVLHACSLVQYDENTFGTLSIVWSSSIIIDGIMENLISGLISFFLTMMTIALILYYAYKKSRSNIENAYYDRVTGLGNHYYLDEYLTSVIKNSNVHASSMVLINSTNFKLLNTTHGFVYGNQILKQMSMRIKEVMNDEMMLFRLNADRFVMIAEGVANKDFLETMAKQLVERFKLPFSDGTNHDILEAEIAIVPIEDSTLSVDQVLQNASLSIAQLKNLPNQSIIFFDLHMEMILLREDRIEKVLRQVSLNQNSDALSLVYQPQLDIKANRIIGFEALARLKHPELGQVSPVEFIRIAEDRLLIYDLGNRIIESACDFAIELHTIHHMPIRVAVNISVKQLLREEFIFDVQKILESKNISAGMLEFEITESAVIYNFELINDKLNQLQRMGILVSMDDFGTGYSSFARLNELNVDIVKIDRFFISKIDLSDNYQLVSGDMISMLHKLDVLVVAEGVETKTQYDYLFNHECDIIQGYYFSKPLDQMDAICFANKKSKERDGN